MPSGPRSALRTTATVARPGRAAAAAGPWRPILATRVPRAARGRPDECLATMDTLDPPLARRPGPMGGLLAVGPGSLAHTGAAKGQPGFTRQPVFGSSGADSARLLRRLCAGHRTVISRCGHPDIGRGRDVRLGARPAAGVVRLQRGRLAGLLGVSLHAARLRPAAIWQVAPAHQRGAGEGRHLLSADAAARAGVPVLADQPADGADHPRGPQVL